MTTLATADAVILAEAFTITTEYVAGTVTTTISINGTVAATDSFVIPEPTPVIP